MLARKPVSTVSEGRNYLAICQASGKIFVAPYNAEKLLIYNPSSNEHKELDLPQEVKGRARKFSGLCRAREMVFAAPRDADHLLICDTATEKLCSVDVTAYATGDRKFCGICQAGGKLVMAPMDADYLLICDVATKELSGLDITHLATGPQKFSAICEARGKVFAAPRCAQWFLIYDPSTGELEGCDVSAFVPRDINYKFSSICQARGKVCAAPFGAQCLLIYDLSAKVLESVDITPHVGRSKAKFSAICQAAGRVFAAPSHVNKLLICDPHTKQVECQDLLRGSKSTEFKFEDICEAGGKVFASPYNSDTLLAFDPATKELQELAVPDLTRHKRKFGCICQVGGKVFAAPHNADRLLIHTPVNFKEVRLGDVKRMKQLPFAEGRFADVHEAWLPDGAHIAVKKPRCGTLSEKDTQTFFLEARIMALVQHPNCMKLLAVCQQRVGLMLITEFLQNGSLYQVLGRNEVQWSVRQRLMWAKQAFDALSFLHCRSPRIIHGDIKPDNMLIDGTYVLKVADFGMARIQSFSNTYMDAGADARVGRRGGTPYYMAPELFENKENSRASDVHSTGIVLHELAFGDPPYTGPNAIALIKSGDRPSAEELYRRNKKEFPLGYFEVYYKSTFGENPASRLKAESVADKLVQLIERGRLARGQADGFDGDSGEAGVISLVGEVRKWQWISSTCKEKRMHFQSVWRSEEEEERLRSWNERVSELARSGRCSQMLVVSRMMAQHVRRQEQFRSWRERVSELARSGRCSQMLVVTHDEEHDGTRYGSSMQNYEVPFLDQSQTAHYWRQDKKKIPYDVVTFTEFMRTYGTWN